MKLPRWTTSDSIGVIVLVLLLLYLPLLVHWYDGWLHKNISIEHEYFSHGLIGLPFAAYLAWSRRDRWQDLPPVTDFSGIALLLLGVACYLSRLIDLVNVSLSLILVGLCLWLKGQQGLRLQAFPLVLVFLATPTQLPYLLVPYTLPLQRLIAGTAAFILLQFGMEVQVNQIYLFVNDRIVEVAPYCAGLKMLFTSLYVGLMLVCGPDAYGTDAKQSQRSFTAILWFFIGIIALSLCANIIRNTLLTFFYGTEQIQAFHWLHEGWAGDLYSTCVLGLVILLFRSVERATRAVLS